MRQKFISNIVKTYIDSTTFINKQHTKTVIKNCDLLTFTPNK